LKGKNGALRYRCLKRRKHQHLPVLEAILIRQTIVGAPTGLIDTMNLAGNLTVERVSNGGHDHRANVARGERKSKSSSMQATHTSSPAANPPRSSAKTFAPPRRTMTSGPGPRYWDYRLMGQLRMTPTTKSVGSNSTGPSAASRKSS
jgi:hypothetical protein